MFVHNNAGNLIKVSRSFLIDAFCRLFNKRNYIFVGFLFVIQFEDMTSHSQADLLSKCHLFLLLFWGNAVTVAAY